ncbi:E3 ubiquitin-protein ligase XB3-like isoform X2 [Triticum dicoccoides]|uniref:E3 ubiquitin-protein ligase XB3-like isoform X2 n=1 Tax=Triticum dicoccoides TaxID=85692 RepID=UPI00188F8F09|nr:E3 ubiquitin-protein ligase XB3-like isoform X2 [Triticum dicoccoides]
MGHGASCGRPSEEVDFFGAAQSGDLARLAAAVSSRPSLLRRTTLFDRLSALHIAAAHGHLQVVSMALDLCVEPDVVNRHKQTALMLAAMHGRTECVRRLLDAGANILMFDSSHGRTCLHYAAYYGHSDCLRAILTAARTAPVSQSWGYARFVNVRDDTGATPLHLAARQGWRRCVHVLLENGAIVSASSGAFGFPGSTPLHLAARGGSLDCVRQLLSWGADRLQRDSVGRIPYEVALKRGHAACAALLNPSSAEPLVWPSPLKFISELEPDAKALLEAALMEANREREKRILKGAKNSLPSPSHSDDGATVSEFNITVGASPYRAAIVSFLGTDNITVGTYLPASRYFDRSQSRLVFKASIIPELIIALLVGVANVPSGLNMEPLAHHTRSIIFMLIRGTNG